MRFSDKVYELVKVIPEGKVTTYKIISNKLKSNAYRSVGTALSKNKRDDVPCHRVINQNGFVGRFSKGGDIKTKIELLKKEGIEFKDELFIDLEKYKYAFK